MYSRIRTRIQEKFKSIYDLRRFFKKGHNGKQFLLNEIDKYANVLKVIFEPKSVDIFEYACSLLRVGGLEDVGWDPMQESQEVFDDIVKLTQLKLGKKIFKDIEKTKWKLGLIGYAHLTEMDAPYHVLANLLRVKGGKKYLLNPFKHLQAGKKRKKRISLIKEPPPVSPTKKIDEIKSLGKMAGLEDIGNTFDEFYYPSLRHSISHSDYVLHDSQFRMIKGWMLDESKNIRTKVVSSDKLGNILTKTFAFYWAFFSLERQARKGFGDFAGKCFAFDVRLKGLLEFLVGDEDGLYGFKVHWPNKLDSVYSRSKKGCECRNIHLEQDGSVNFFVGEFFSQHEVFSQLVPKGESPEYTQLEGTHKQPIWPGNKN